MLPVDQKSTIHLLSITLFIESSSIGIVIPVMPSLIVELSGKSLGDAAVIGGWLLFSYSLFQLFAGPLLGFLSDKIGRRPVLIASLLGYAVDTLIFAFSSSIIWLFVGRSIAGAFMSTYATTIAFVSDITKKRERSKAFGYLAASWSLGLVIGPAMGGMLGSISIRMPFIISAAAALVNALLVYIFLRESSTDHRVGEQDILGPVDKIRRILSETSGVLRNLVAVFLIIRIAQITMPAIWAYFTAERFSWNEWQIGVSMAYIGALSVIATRYLTGPAIKMLGELGAMKMGLSFFVIGYVGCAFASEGWMVYVAHFIGCFGAISAVILQSLISQMVPDDHQGSIHGVLAGLGSLGAIIGSVVMTNLFFTFTSNDGYFYFPGAPLLLGGALIVICIFLVSIIKSYTVTAKNIVIAWDGNPPRG